ncbi:MAG: arsenosugar biosynthesis radical SAM protein ArsS [SAR324 cluster bacterium]|nr:arsenosugar biosynthesis radical SAM protein ArsS [SAR324 cluster bacterium]
MEQTESLDIDWRHRPQPDRFAEKLRATGMGALHRGPLQILQINVGKLCNQTCRHCHVEAGPTRKEIMPEGIVKRMVTLAADPTFQTIDITGGAPEMNPHFRTLVKGLAPLGKEIIVRCNLTIIEQPGYEWLPEFYRDHRIHLICSLPCYGPENVAKQRGHGVFEKSVRAMAKLNALGYGQGNEALRLDLMYNPLGTTLPPPQAALEADYKRELGKNCGVTFNHLLILTNLPIGRFRQDLKRAGKLEDYIEFLAASFNGETVPHLMCRSTLSVGWDGKLYDCDFNQMLELEINGGASIFDGDFNLDDLKAARIKTGSHCLGCTAGAGSSCGGALTA